MSVEVWPNDVSAYFPPPWRCGLCGYTNAGLQDLCLGRVGCPGRKQEERPEVVCSFCGMKVPEGTRCDACGGNLDEPCRGCELADHDRFPCTKPEVADEK